MARTLYGGTGGDLVVQISSDGDFEPGTAVFDVFDDRTAGAQMTDLQTLAGAATDEVTPDSFGRIWVWSEDGYYGSLWLQDQANPTDPRWEISPTNMPDVVAALVAAGGGGGGGPVAAADITDATPTGIDLITAASDTAALDSLGGTAVGKAFFVAANSVAAQTALGASTVGKALIVATNTDAAQTAIGATDKGKELIEAADAAAARGAIGAGEAGLLSTAIQRLGATPVHIGSGRTGLPAAGSGQVDGDLFAEEIP